MQKFLTFISLISLVLSSIAYYNTHRCVKAIELISPYTPSFPLTKEKFDLVIGTCDEAVFYRVEFQVKGTPQQKSDLIKRIKEKLSNAHDIGENEIVRQMLAASRNSAEPISITLIKL